MIEFIDSLLDKITMYRLLVYYLIALLGAATLLSMFGVLSYDPLSIIFDSLFLFGACWLANQLFSMVFEAPSNRDSSYVTALILALIIRPTSTPHGALFLAAAAGLAIASKYMITINRRHIFNPAAIAVVLTSLAAGDSASWWVGSAAMLPFVLVGGVLIVRKVHSARMVVSFLLSATGSTMLYAFLSGASVLMNVQNLLLSSGLFFLAFVMLTEPFTAPTTRGGQTWYGILVGALLPPQVHIASFYTAPELALIAGNMFTFFTTPHFRVFARLQSRVRIAPATYDFVLTTNDPFHFQPGQYVEWTLPHHQQDARGTRRYFTIASSPTEQNIRLGIKFYEKGSSYKQALLALPEASSIVGSRLGGEFTMPHDSTRKLAFIAGGIGVTPYRSMIKYLTDTNESRPITLLYAAANPEDFTYTDVFEAARKRIGIETIYVVTRATDQPAQSKRIEHGALTADMIKKRIPDYQERLFYISGPHGMVETTKAQLLGLGVSRKNIKTDFFSGYA